MPSMIVKKLNLFGSSWGLKWTDPYFWTENLQDWLESNGKAAECLFPRNPPWKFVLLFTIWIIWKNGNQVVIKGKSQSPSLATKTKNWAVEYLFCASSPRSANRLVLRQIRWEKPQTGWKKLNTDGSFIGNAGSTGCGGIIWDEHGHWVKGYAIKIRITNSFIAEL